MKRLQSSIKHHGTFGNDSFGAKAEQFARFFGTAKFIIAQTVLVVLWIVLNGFAVFLRWDPYPFILLNLMFSTQAAYAAPLILLAQTRQADRDKTHTEARELVADQQQKLIVNNTQLLTENTTLTEKIAQLTEEIHQLVQSERKVG